MADVEMVERAAKAHYERLHYTSWEYLTPSTRAGFLAAMRAAIEALREPTKEMCLEAAKGANFVEYVELLRASGARELGLPPEMVHTEAMGPAATYAAWRLMIDAILKEEGNG